MFSRDVRIEDIDARQWNNLVRLFEVDTNAYLGVATGRLPLVILLEDGRPVKAVRLGRGRVPLAEVPWYGPSGVERVRQETGAAILFAAEIATMREVLREIESRVRLDEDGVAQALKVARTAQVHIDRGLYLAPRPLKGLPIPSYDAVQRTFDLLYPDDRAAAFYLFDGNEVHTALVTAKRGGDIVLVTTHQGVNVPVSDWRRDHGRIVDAIERRYARPFLGFFAELSAWQRIIGGGGSFSRELAQKNIILEPAPPWLLALVAAEAGAQVAQAGAGLLKRFVPQQLQNMARDLAQKAADKGPFALLGFNPFQVAGELLKLARRPPK